MKTWQVVWGTISYVRCWWLGNMAGITIIFLGFQVPTQDEFRAFHSRMNELTAGLPTTVMVSSNGDADLFA